MPQPFQEIENPAALLVALAENEFPGSGPEVHNVTGVVYDQMGAVIFRRKFDAVPSQYFRAA